MPDAAVSQVYVAGGCGFEPTTPAEGAKHFRVIQKEGGNPTEGSL